MNKLEVTPNHCAMYLCKVYMRYNLYADKSSYQCDLGSGCEGFQSGLSRETQRERDGGFPEENRVLQSHISAVRSR